MIPWTAGLANPTACAETGFRVGTRSCHRPDGLAEAAQCQPEEDTADRHEGEALRPDDRDVGPAIQDNLGERDELNSRRPQHELEVAHTLKLGGATARF